MSDERAEELMCAYLDSAATSAELAELDRLLRADPAAAAMFLDYAELHAGLTGAAAVDLRSRARRTPGSSRRVRLLAVAAILVAGIAIAWEALGRPAPSSAAAAPAPAMQTPLALSAMDAALTRGPATTALSDGMPLRVDDAIATGPAGMVVITVPDGSRVRLGPSTRVTLAGASGLQPLHLLDGRIDAQIAPQAPASPVRIAGPQATATVVGTRLAVIAAEGVTRLEVAEGHVRFAATGGQECLVSSGGCAVADHGGGLHQHDLGDGCILDDFAGPRMSGEGLPLWMNSDRSPARIAEGSMVMEPGADGTCMAFFAPFQHGWTFPVGYAQSRLVAGAWSPDWNRLRFWLRSSRDLPRRADGGTTFSVTTHVRRHDDAERTDQGRIFQHLFDPPIHARRWLLIALDRTPQHESGSTRWPGENPTGPGLAYFDGLTQLEIACEVAPPGGTRVEIDALRFSRADPAPDDRVASITAGYSGERYEVTWSAPWNQAAPYELRYAVGELPGDDPARAQDGGQAMPRGGPYASLLWTSAPMAEVPLFSVAIRPIGSPTWTRIAIPRR